MSKRAHNARKLVIDPDYPKKSYRANIEKNREAARVYAKLRWAAMSEDDKERVRASDRERSQAYYYRNKTAIALKNRESKRKKALAELFEVSEKLTQRGEENDN